MLGKDGMYYDISFLELEVICYSVQSSSLLWSNIPNFYLDVGFDVSMIPFDFNNIITFAFAELLDFVCNKKNSISPQLWLKYQ